MPPSPQLGYRQDEQHTKARQIDSQLISAHSYTQLIIQHYEMSERLLEIGTSASLLTIYLHFHISKLI